MFKLYGTKTPKNPDSQLMQNIKLLVPEARERYGLVGNTNITDDEIAGALYKRAIGFKTGAVNEAGEPIILFRGDTERYDKLRDRIPEDYETAKGVDNALGTLFLGEYPGTKWDSIKNGVGASRYLRGKHIDRNGKDFVYRNSNMHQKPGYVLYDTVHENPVFKDDEKFYFVKDASTSDRPNDLNAFLVKTDSVRDGTREIAVSDENNAFLFEDFDTAEFADSYVTSKQIKDDSGKWVWLNEDGSVTTDPKKAFLSHYKHVINDAKAKNQGLIVSKANSPLRTEHQLYTYYAVPNFNKNNVKHLFKYNLLRPTINKVDDGLIYR